MACFVAVLWIAASLGACFEIIVAKQVHDQLSAEARSFIRSIEKIYAEIDTTFDSLDITQPAKCTPGQILKMKRAMFRFPHIQDILLFEDGGYVPQCSAMLGVLSNATPLPKPEPLPYTRDDSEIWFDLPLELFDGRIASYVIKRHHYAITANMAEIRHLSFYNSWETFVPDEKGDFSTHVDGQRGLIDRYLKDKGNLLLSPFVHAERSKRVTAGIVVAIPVAQGIERNALPLIIGIVFSVGTGAMVYFLIMRVLTNRGAPMGRIKAALKRGQGFSCAYQPIVSLPQGKAIGCEVLSRFEDELGIIRPDEFIPVIIELNKTWEFTERMMERSLEELDFLLREKPDFKVSVNVFPRDLDNEYLGRISTSKPILHAVSRRIPLNFEILETGFSDAQKIAKTLAFFRALNFTVAIDDFGTGSSNLHELRDVHAHYIKIDKSFVQGLARRDSSIRSSLIPHIVDMANAVHAEVIAEGAETVAQVQILSSLQIKYVQGYFFSRPVTVTALAAFVEEDRVFDLADQGGVSDEPSKTRPDTAAA